MRLDTSKAVDLFGIQEGDVRAVDWKFVVHQYPAREGAEQSSPFTALKVTMVGIDEKGNVTSDPDEKFYPICWTSRKDGSLDFLPSDDGKEASGDEPGSEGSILIEGRTGANWSKNSTSFKFIKALEECGVDFPEDVSALNGLEGYIHTIIEKYKTREGKEGESRVSLFKKVEMDSLKAGKKGKGKDKPAAGKPASAKKAKDEDEDGGDGDGGDDDTGVVASVLGGVIADLRKQGKTEVSDKVFRSRVTLKSSPLSKPDKKVLDAVMKGDDDDINAILAEFNALLDDGKLMIAEEDDE